MVNNSHSEEEELDYSEIEEGEIGEFKKRDEQWLSDSGLGEEISKALVEEDSDRAQML